MKFGERRQMIGYISPPKSRRPQDFYNLVNLGKTEKLRFFSGYQFTTLFRDQISRVYGPLLLSRFCDHLMSDASQNKLLKWSFAYLFKKNGDDAASYRLGLPKICVLLRLCGLL